MGMWSKLVFWISISTNIWLFGIFMIRGDLWIAFWLAFLTVALFVIFGDERKGNDRTDHERIH